MSPVEVGRALGMRKAKLKNSPDNTLVLPNTSLGVEFEFERVTKISQDDLAAIGMHWTMKEDHSLHDAGKEFAFIEPLFGADVVDAIHNLTKIATVNRWACTLRTGIHVHMDARDLTNYQLKGLLAYYLMFEPAIYAWVGGGREANNFCVPWYKSEGSIQDAITILQMLDMFGKDEESTDSLLNKCDHFHKYAGLNLRSLANFGSIEFRQLPTTTDRGRIFNWINILLRLKKAATEAPESTMVLVQDVWRRGIRESLYSVFGQEIAAAMLQENSYNTLDDIRTVGCSNAVELIVESSNHGAAKTSTLYPYKDTNQKRLQHKGVTAWLEKNFPKEKNPNQGAQPPPLQANHQDQAQLGEAPASGPRELGERRVRNALLEVGIIREVPGLNTWQFTDAGTANDYRNAVGGAEYINALVGRTDFNARWARGFVSLRVLRRHGILEVEPPPVPTEQPMWITPVQGNVVITTNPTTNPVRRMLQDSPFEAFEDDTNF